MSISINTIIRSVMKFNTISWISHTIDVNMIFSHIQIVKTNDIVCFVWNSYSNSCLMSHYRYLGDFFEHSQYPLGIVTEYQLFFYPYSIESNDKVNLFSIESLNIIFVSRFRMILGTYRINLSKFILVLSPSIA